MLQHFVHHAPAKLVLLRQIGSPAGLGGGRVPHRLEKIWPARHGHGLAADRLLLETELVVLVTILTTAPRRLLERKQRIQLDEPVEPTEQNGHGQEHDVTRIPAEQPNQFYYFREAKHEYYFCSE